MENHSFAMPHWYCPLNHPRYPKRTRAEIRAFVGNGILNLMQKAVPMGTAEEKIKDVLLNALSSEKGLNNKYKCDDEVIEKISYKQFYFLI